MSEQSEKEFSILHRLVKKGDLAALRNALDSGAKANVESKYGYSLLMMAAVEGNVPIGRLLISREANVNQVSQHDWSAVLLAVNGGHTRFLELLLEHRASPTGKLFGVPIEERLPHYQQFSPKKEAALLALLREYRAKISG